MRLDTTRFSFACFLRFDDLVPCVFVVSVFGGGEEGKVREEVVGGVGAARAHGV